MLSFKIIDEASLKKKILRDLKESEENSLSNLLKDTMFCRKTQRDKEEVTLMDRKMLHTRKFSLTFIKK